MPIIINHNLCDEADACGGISVCPSKAFYYDYEKMRIAIYKNKCTECLKCTLPDACSVGCILYARDKSAELKIKKMIKEDPRTAKWLWRERYGCQPAKTPPKATVITDKIFEKVYEKGYKLIDIWSEATLDCRAFSFLFKDILKGIDKQVIIFKIDGSKLIKLTKGLKVSKMPTFILLKNGKEIYRFEGLMKGKDLKKVNSDLKKLIK